MERDAQISCVLIGGGSVFAAGARVLQICGADWRSTDCPALLHTGAKKRPTRTTVSSVRFVLITTRCSNLFNLVTNYCFADGWNLLKFYLETLKISQPIRCLLKLAWISSGRPRTLNVMFKAHHSAARAGRVAARLAGLPGLEVPSCLVLAPAGARTKTIGDNIWHHSLTSQNRLDAASTTRSAAGGQENLNEIQPTIVHGQGTEREFAMAAALSGFPNFIPSTASCRTARLLRRSRPGSYLWLRRDWNLLRFHRTAGLLCNSAYT